MVQQILNKTIQLLTRIREAKPSSQSYSMVSLLPIGLFLEKKAITTTTSTNPYNYKYL